jgi:hypothetical protein
MRNRKKDGEFFFKIKKNWIEKKTGEEEEQ